MKVMAIGNLQPLTEAQWVQQVPAEIPPALRLYLEARMEQFWHRAANTGVIFVINVSSADEADCLLKTLPLRVAALRTFDLMPVGPQTPLGQLLHTSPGLRVQAGSNTLTVISEPQFDQVRLQK
ncbi:hypothetical protein [Chitinimonas sp.]|uniref:hypothetical protein n=1 Tax=Chitinimonas sp. TaxID=1934313 RepID=UPI002F9233D5